MNTFRRELLNSVEQLIRYNDATRIGQAISMVVSLYPPVNKPDSVAYSASDEELMQSILGWQEVTPSRSIFRNDEMFDKKHPLLAEIQKHSTLHPDWRLTRVLANFSYWAGNSKPWYIELTEDEEFLNGALNPQESELLPDPDNNPIFFRYGDLPIR
ncbi:MAG: hypothetical protein R3C11_28310 [Planctomycetaceae bacterium]